MQKFELFANLIIPIIVVLSGVIMLFGGKDYFSCFIEGAKEGFMTAVNLIPTLVALLCCISMLKVSGAIQMLACVLENPLSKIGIPVEILPLLISRPFSGSASSALFSSLLEQVSPDAFCALYAAVIMGSSETGGYVVSVYFSSIKIKKTSKMLDKSLKIV